jgi:hypothetical protein
MNQKPAFVRAFRLYGSRHSSGHQQSLTTASIASGSLKAENEKTRWQPERGWRAEQIAES